MSELREVSAAVVGRELELSRVARFIAGEGSCRALVLMGEAGIGKTTLWESAVQSARDSGSQVQVARPSEPELQLSFVALSDLLEDVDTGGLERIPVPQLRALEVALLRAEPGEAPPDPLAVAAGFTRVLRVLSERGPLVVAIDDVPWLDRASAESLAFAARRLRGRHVRFLLARRPGEPSALETAFVPAGLERVEVGALSLGAVRLLLDERLGLRPPRRVLLRLFDLSQGSPLVTLELGRALVERGLPDVGEELPLPELVDDLFAERIAAVAPAVRQALLAVALAGGLSRLELSGLVGPLALEDAITEGVLVLDGSRVRASHPLLAAAARRRSSAGERRDLHLALARTIADETLQARHLALAASRRDAALAGRIAAAAAKAVGRGAIHDAVEVAEQALRLTPIDSPEYVERLLELARYLQVAGEESRVRDLLGARLADLPRGPARARALLMLADTGERLSEMESRVDSALAECGDEAELRSTALAVKALIYAIVRFRKLEQAERWAQEALQLARSAGVSGAESRALHALAWIDVLRGRPLDHSGSPAAPPQAASLYESAIERPAGIRLMVRGHVHESRAVFDRLRALAGERGEALSASVMHRQLCEIELRAGDVAAAQRHLEQWGEWTLPEDTHEQLVGLARCRALLEAVRGNPDEAARWAAEAITAAEAIENYREETEARRAAGIAALRAHEPAQAVDQLRPLWLHAEREGIDEPGAIPVAPDLVEALVELDELDQARSVAGWLARRAEEQEHPWGLAGTKRCRALIGFATRDKLDEAEAALAEAAAAYRELGLRFDAARSLLILGRAQRRRRKWAAARAALESAAQGFEELSASGWVEETRAELARVGGRQPTPEGALSNTERQVAALAAEGRSNKQIAAELHVTVHTVEKHLSRAYAKLGIQSRRQLPPQLDAAQ